MDRFSGLEAMNEAEAYALMLERQQWEADRAAIAEYESWFLHKTIMEPIRNCKAWSRRKAGRNAGDTAPGPNHNARPYGDLTSWLRTMVAKVRKAA